MVFRIIFVVALLVLSVYNFFYKISILQNQYYSIKRYVIYKKENMETIVINLFFALLSFILCFWNESFSFLFLFFFINHLNFKNIKLTNRIVIQFIVFCILNALNILFLLFNYSIHLLFIYSYSCFWISFIISSFIEKIKCFFFIKKAQNKLKKYKVTTIAITGSFGKTSCKNYCYELIKNQYKVLMTPHSYNTLNGVLLTINNLLKPYHEILILEIGVDCKKGMDKFTKYFDFDFCLVSAIGSQHIKTFKSIENIFNEKIKLLTNAKKGVVLNKDDLYLKRLNLNIKTISASSKDEKQDIHIQKVDNQLLIKIFTKQYKVNSSLIGKHNLSNLACCIAMAKLVKVDDYIIINAIENIKNVEHRLSINKVGKWTIIDDSYNANYVGFNNALDEIKNYGCYKVIITPGVIEQINDSSLELSLANKINSTCDLIILIDNPPISKYIDNKLSFNSFKDAYTYLKENYIDKELVLLIENDVPDIYLR